MRLVQEVRGADAVVADQAEQRRAVAQPVLLAQPAASWLTPTCSTT